MNEPNALRLAKWLDAMPSSGYALPNQAATELRRLHEEVNEQARLLGMSAERELALLAKIDRLEKQLGEAVWNYGEKVRVNQELVARFEAQQPAQGCDYCNNPHYAGTKCKNCGREKLAQQQPDEFTLRGILASELKCWHRLTEDEAKNLVDFVKNMQAKPAQQEPVGEITAEDMGRPFNAIRINTHFYKEIPPVGTKLYTTPQPPAQPLTDDPLQGAVDWLLEADGEYFCTATVQRTLRIGYNRAKRLCDTAKERAVHGITKGNT